MLSHMCRREWANSTLEQTSLSLLASPVSSSVAGGVLAARCDIVKDVSPPSPAVFASWKQDAASLALYS